MSFFIEWNRGKFIRAAGLALMVVLACGHSPLLAGTPDWLKQAAQMSLQNYSSDVDAVVLLNERIVTVSASGEVRTVYRKAYKLLRPQGRDRGRVYVYFDPETRLTWLKAWSITSRNEEYEVKEGDAIETSLLSESLYADSRYKLLQIPASQPGSIIGYEYEQKERPKISQANFIFQDEIPVRSARFTLVLPSDWSYIDYWRNYAPAPPRQSGQNRWTWEFQNVEAIQSESEMPVWRSVAGQLGVSFSPKRAQFNYTTWAQIGKWYTDLSAGRRDVTPALRAKAHEIVAGVDDPSEKIRRLAFFVQHSVRYVAIEIGVGGYQPHFAQDILTSGYGDCKDKVTLLSALLHEIGIDSYYVLINTERDYLSPEFPTPLSFNHVILAIKFPIDTGTGQVFSVLPHKDLGPLALFDPTDSVTAFGYLPASLQSNFGLLVTDSGGELVKLPLLVASTNRIFREATLTLDKDGNLNGTVEEIRSGQPAAELRQQLSSVPNNRRQDVLQDLLNDLVDGAVLKQASVSDASLRKFEGMFAISYAFSARGYAQHHGPLFLFRPCVLGRKSNTLLEGKVRKQPVEFPYAASEGDVIHITFPDGYSIEDTPRNVNYQYPIATYKSETRADGHVLHYIRNYEMKDVRVSLDRLDDLRNLYRDIAVDERSFTIMKLSAAR